MMAWASSFRPLSFEELEAKTTTVVEARAMDQRVEFARDGSPETYVRFEALDLLKGNLASEFELVIPGGSKDGLEYHIVGYPTFKMGASYVLFIEPDSAGFFQIQEAQSGVIQILDAGLSSPLALPVQTIQELKTSFKARTLSGAMNRQSLSVMPAPVRSHTPSELNRISEGPKPLELSHFWALLGVLGLLIWLLQGRKKP
jgi:hypothetical protein